MVERYLTPVLALAGGEPIVAIVERYLVNDRSIEITARELAVHPNTVRHRLGRFEEIIQRSPRITEAIVEIWWALQRRRI